jgi:6-phosphogluconolactonase
MTEPAVIICRDADDLARQAAAQFVSLAANSAVRSSRFIVALSGGSTPRALYSLLASPAFKDRIDWRRIHFFWGDERCVPPDHSESNYRMVHEALLSKVDIAPENIHRLAGEKEPEIAASEYEDELRRTFQLTRAQVPRFGLILLGLGEDGHTASLFPGQATVHENTRWVMATLAPDGKLWRITLTPVIINAARNVTFVVSGASKAGRLRQLIEGPFDPDTLPAQAIQPDQGRLTYMVDDAAFAAISDPGPQSSSRAKRGI